MTTRLIGLSFYTKDLYLVTTQKLTVKSVAVFMKTGGFHEKQQFSWKALQFSWKVAVFTRKPYKSTNSRQILQFHCVLGGGYVWCFHKKRRFSWKLPLFSENHHFSWKLAVFTEKQRFSLGNLINQLIQDKSFSFIVCLGEAMSDDSMKSARKTTNCQEW